MSERNENYLTKLIKIAERHKDKYEWGGELSVTINGHHGCYDKIEDYLLRYKDDFLSCKDFLEKADECMRKNNVVEISFYPRSPNAFFSMFGADIEEVAKRMIDSLEKDEKDNHVHFKGYKLLKDE